MTDTLTYIGPNRAWWRVDWREIGSYGDLMRFLVRRDLIAVYKQSILGPVWHVLNPILTAVVFTLVFNRIGRIETDTLPPFLFNMCGIVFWNYFQSCINNVGNALMANARLFSKVYFPRLIVPLSLVVSSLMQFGVNLLIFIGFLIAFNLLGIARVLPSAWLWLAPLALMQTVAVGLGVGLWLSALTVKYRDVRFVLPFLSQLWLYCTPVIYPLSLVSERYRGLLALNPMTWVIEFSRLAFLGQGSAHAGVVAIGTAVGAVLLLSGVLVFNRVERTFVDTI